MRTMHSRAPVRELPHQLLAANTSVCMVRLVSIVWEQVSNNAEQHSRCSPAPPAAGVQLWTNGAGFLLGLTALQDLSLATTELTSPGHAASLRHLTGLTRLQLHNNALADPKDVADMVASMPHLQLLSVSFTTLDSKAVVHIARSLRHLSALLFDGCPVSTLGVVQCLRVSHCKLRCWSKGEAEL